MGRMNLDSKPLNLSLPQVTIDRLKAAAKADGKSVSGYVASLLDNAQAKKPKRKAVRS